MILVSKSKGLCGGCGNEIEIEWDLDLIDSCKKAEGVSSNYESCENWECDACGNILKARLWMVEYPEGVVEDCGVDIVEEQEGNSFVEVPDIQLFDL